jgi:HAD superfamily hydrolase (TIGR01509 family)
LLQAALVDLGDTLVHLDRPWDGVFSDNVTALYGYLKQHGLNEDVSAFAKRFAKEFEAASYAADFYKIEIPIDEIISRTLQKVRFDGLNGLLLQNAMEQYYGPELESWHPFPDTLVALDGLKTQGLTMAVVSNTKSDWMVNTIISKYGLEKYFRAIVSSAMLRVRKPRAEIFLRALETIDAKPSETVVIGDSMQADIFGARRLGMRSIHLNRKPDEDSYRVDPDATANSLTEALNRVVAWRTEQKSTVPAVTRLGSALNTN